MTAESTRTYDAVMLSGEGIGREVMAPAFAVLEAVGNRHGFGIQWTEAASRVVGAVAVLLASKDAPKTPGLGGSAKTKDIAEAPGGGAAALTATCDAPRGGQHAPRCRQAWPSRRGAGDRWHTLGRPVGNGRSVWLGLAVLVATSGTGLAVPAIPYDPQNADHPVTVRLGDGVEFKPYYLTDLQQAGFAESAPGGQAAGLNLRRQQQGGELYIGGQVNLGFVWDFGGSPGSRARLLEGQVSYVGLKPVTATVGVLKPQFSIESVEDGADIFLIERASIVNVTRNLAASSGREAVQVVGSGPRWLAGAALTAGLTGVSRDSGQRAAVGRVLGLPVRTGDLTLEVGASGQYVWRPANTTGAGPSVNLSNTVELAVDAVPPSVSTGTLLARNAAVTGVEVSASWRNLLVQGEYYGVNVARAAGSPDLRFSGWYLQAAYTLLGAPRRWSDSSGVWMPAASREGFSPREGRWGTVEAVVRYSTVNLNAADVRGGRQDTWTVGASYWPVLPLRLMAEFLHAEVAGGPSPRTVNAVAGRILIQF